MSTDPVPQRLSDADRDNAVDLLREHYAAGRLSTTELDERLSAALQARYRSDLAPLFADLPDPHPAALDPAGSWTETDVTSFAPAGMALEPRQVANAPARVNRDYVSIARSVLWPAAIFTAILTGWWWPMIALAIVGSIVLRQMGPGRTPPPYGPGG